VVTDCGDSCIRILSTASTPDARWTEVHHVVAALERTNVPGISDIIATYDAALVEFDCTTITHAEIRSLVGSLESAAPTPDRAPTQFVVPVVYGGEHGPDLPVVASLLGMDESDVVALHSATPLTMRCFGSPGGAPMLDGPAFGRPIPRLTSPRAHVPPGAVAVAGMQAVVSARPAPGGWQVLGRTPKIMVNPSREPLSPFAPGDTFRFVPIQADRWDEHVGDLHG
jgi:KipI family sensor histidine kinase inhibitor